MATQLTETKWHGNPRPILSYATTVFDETVASPYYKDGRDVPTYAHFVTAQPLANLAPAVSAQVNGPAILVSWQMDGLWKAPTTLSVGVTVTGGTDISTQIAFADTFLGPADAATAVAGALATLSPDVDAAAVGQVVSLTIAGTSAATALTIITLTVA